MPNNNKNNNNNNKKLRIMKKKKENAKRAAYTAKQEKEGRNVVKWIIGVLLAMGIIYTCWVFAMMS